MASLRTKAEMLLVVVTFFWGATFVVVQRALADASPLAFVALRFLLAGSILFLLTGFKRPTRQGLRASLILGVVLCAGFVLQTWGQAYTSPSKCAFITAFSVILVPIILAMMGARMGKANVAGAILGLTGIYLLVAPSAPGGANRGDVLTLLCAVAFAVYIVLLERYSRMHSYAELAPSQILFVGLLASAGLPFGHTFRVHWTGVLLAAIAFTAVFATAFAFSAQAWAQRCVPAAHTALIFALEPVFAALTSYVVAGERLGGRGIAGSVCVLGAVAISEWWGRSATAIGEV